MRNIEKRVDESIGWTRRTMRAVALAGLGNPSDILEKKNKKIGRRSGLNRFCSAKMQEKTTTKKRNTVRYMSCAWRRISRVQTQLLQSATVKKKRKKIPLKTETGCQYYCCIQNITAIREQTQNHYLMTNQCNSTFGRWKTGSCNERRLVSSVCFFCSCFQWDK